MWIAIQIVFCIITFQVVGSSAARVRANPPPKFSSFRIPLQKHHSVQNTDGTFNAPAALRMKAKTQNTYRQNLLHYQANLKHDPPNSIPPPANASEFLKNFSKHSPHSAGDPQRRRSLVAAVPLIDEDNNLEWTGTVQIGTPPQNFTIDFNTGASDFWVSSSSCSSCASHNLYNASASDSSELQPGNFSIAYADGSNITGDIYTEIVTVGDINVNSQFFGVVTQESGELANGNADGLMGMAWQALSVLNERPFLWTAIAEDSIDGVFGLKLNASGAELFIGGTNPSLYTGALETHVIASEDSPGYWQLNNTSMLVNSQSAVSGFTTIFDSGTTLMYGNTSAVEQFYNAIDGSWRYDSANGLWAIPCNSSSTIALSWGGAPWSISMEYFKLGQLSTNETMCQGALAEMELGSTWLVGDTFLMNVYTAFSATNKTVSFASLG